MNFHDENRIKDIKMDWKQNISKEVADTTLNLTHFHLQDLLQKYRDTALNQVKLLGCIKHTIKVIK